MNLFVELDLSTMGVGITRQPGNRPPVVAHDAKIVHHASMLVQARAKDPNPLGIIELPIEVNRCSPSEPLEICTVNINDTFVSSKTANGLPGNRRQEIGFEGPNRLLVTHDPGRSVNGIVQNFGSLCVLSEIASNHAPRTFPNSMRGLDQPAVHHVAEAIPVSNPQSCLRAFPLVHGRRRRPRMNDPPK